MARRSPAAPALGFCDLSKGALARVAAALPSITDVSRCSMTCKAFHSPSPVDTDSAMSDILEHGLLLRAQQHHHFGFAPVVRRTDETIIQWGERLYAAERVASEIRQAMVDWSALLAECDKAQSDGTLSLPEWDRFCRCLGQINLSKRAMLSAQYCTARDNPSSVQLRTLLLLVLKRLGYALLSTLLQRHPVVGQRLGLAAPAAHPPAAHMPFTTSAASPAA